MLWSLSLVPTLPCTLSSLSHSLTQALISLASSLSLCGKVVVVTLPPGGKETWEGLQWKEENDDRVATQQAGRDVPPQPWTCSPACGLSHLVMNLRGV